MYFTGINKQGKREGMVSEIAENIPAEIVSIRHYGLLDGDKEITEGPRVKKWANVMETYHFSEENGVTTVNVEQEMNEDFKGYFDEAWPKALNRLKEICENS